jgi:nitrate/TMAO reductase-like tetraheme cytochrome c subunit
MDKQEWFLYREPHEEGQHPMHLRARTASIATGLVGGLLAAATSSASSGQTALYSPPADAVMVWATRGALAMALCSVALILFELTVRRRLMESRSKWTLFLALCVIPLPVALVGGGVGMEGSKALDFCGSCHAPMGPFVGDLKDPASTHLAALHFKNWYIQHDHCWTCHSDYGVAGTMQAKLMGLTHIYRERTDSWQPPIRLSHPYNWKICLDCHANSALFKAPRNDPAAHDGVLGMVLKGEVTCTDCHELAHPAPEQRSIK